MRSLTVNATIVVALASMFASTNAHAIGIGICIPPICSLQPKKERVVDHRDASEKEERDNHTVEIRPTVRDHRTKVVIRDHRTGSARDHRN